MKLFIGVPSAGDPAAPFLATIGKVALPQTITAVERSTVVGNFVPGARELLVRKALNANAGFLLMCDDDMVVPPDALSGLLGVMEAHPRCALAGALYYTRDGIRPMVASGWRPEDTTSAFTPAFDDRTPVAVDAVGFGCVLLRMSAVLDLQPAYFSAQVFVQMNASRVRICNEDYLFCARLREAGWNVMLHPAVKCGHYDRATGQTFPREWESAEQTNVDRMAVLKDGALCLVPVDDAAERMHEVHEQATLDYILA